MQVHGNSQNSREYRAAQHFRRRDAVYMQMSFSVTITPFLRDYAAQKWRTSKKVGKSAKRLELVTFSTRNSCIMGIFIESDCINY